MDLQDEARVVRDGALAILRKHGEWIAPPAFAQMPVRTNKATVGDFQMLLHAPDESATQAISKPTGADSVKDFRLQIWWKGRQVAHMEWGLDGSSPQCRNFAKGEWRDDLAALRR